MDFPNPVKWVTDAVTGLVSKPLEQWGERKKIKVEAETKVRTLQAEAEVARANVQLEMAKKGQEVEADWDARAQEQMKFSKKDEILMFIIFFPVVLLFISAFFVDAAFQNRVIASVNALNQFPMWYIVLICGIVAAVFGLRWLIAPLITSKIARIQNGKRLNNE